MSVFLSPNLEPLRLQCLPHALHPVFFRYLRGLPKGEEVDHNRDREYQPPTDQSVEGPTTGERGSWNARSHWDHHYLIVNMNFRGCG